MKFGKRVDFRQMRVESAYKCATLSHDLATGLCVAGLVCLDLKKMALHSYFAGQWQLPGPVIQVGGYS
jgi:hypothetical protein